MFSLATWATWTTWTDHIFIHINNYYLVFLATVFLSAFFLPLEDFSAFFATLTASVFGAGFSATEESSAFRI